MPPACAHSTCCAGGLSIMRELLRLLVDEDVDLAAVHFVEVEETLIPVEGVEAAVSPVAERLEQLLHRGALLGGSDEIQVTVFTLERRLAGTGTVQIDGGAADQLDG